MWGSPTHVRKVNKPCGTCMLRAAYSLPIIRGSHTKSYGNSFADTLKRNNSKTFFVCVSNLIDCKITESPILIEFYSFKDDS
jgi:hypothetical protein